LMVIFQPPLSRATRPCEKMSRSGTRAQPLRTVAPVATAGRQDRHVALDASHRPSRFPAFGICLAAVGE
jgi:hypothetical protein